MTSGSGNVSVRRSVARELACVCFSLLLALAFVAAEPAAAGDQDTDALAKKIERSLGGIKFRISSEPQKAEKQFVEAHRQFQELKAQAPEHASVPKIGKKLADLKAKLEKRLGRAVALGPSEEPPATAADSASLKKLHDQLRAVKRHIVTEPGRADEELARAKTDLEALKAAAPGDPGVSELEVELQGLAQKLDKRLGRTTTEEAEAARPAEAATPEPAPVAAPEAEVATAKPAPAAAPKAEKLPGGVTKRLKDIAKELDKAEAAVAKGGTATQSAKRNIEKADRKMSEIQRQYGDQVPPTHPEMKAAEERLAAVRANVESALAGGKAEREQAEAERLRLENLRMEGQSKLVDIRSAAFAADSEAELAEAQKEFAAFKEEYREVFPPDDRMVKEVEAKMAEWGGGLAVEAASAEWVEKLRPYVSGGSDKMVVAAATANLDELMDRKARYEEASTVFADYQKAEFEQGKSDELQRLEEELGGALEEFPQAYEQSIDYIVEPAEESVTEALTHLTESEAEWGSDATTKPPIIDSDRMQGIRERVAKARQAGADTPRFGELEQKLALLEETDQKHRKIRAERTFMTPDRFEEDGIDALKEKAQEVVLSDIDDAEVMRVTVISPEWKEEEVTEWTDTTQTALRTRITRSVTAQVAAKQGDEVYLHTLYLGKDRRSDGSWGALKGHIMFTDWMSEGNVDRDGP